MGGGCVLDGGSGWFVDGVDGGSGWFVDGVMVDQGGVVVCARGLFGVWDEFLYWGFWV